jgi:hypothetical protein
MEGVLIIKRIKKRIIITVSIILSLVIILSILLIAFNIKVYKTPSSYTQEDNTGFKIDKEKYPVFYNNSKPMFEIPGLKQGIIPQGICYSKENNLVIISGYHQGKAPSVLFLVDYDSGKLIKTVILNTIDGDNNYSHVGGLATFEDNLWITDNYKIYTYSINELLNTSDMSTIKPIATNSTEVKADFANFSNNVLWVGEYYYKNIYTTKTNHKIQVNDYEENNALLFGYKIKDNNKIDYTAPDMVVSIPDRVQGIAINSAGNIIISQSFWSFQPSNIATYENIFSNKTEKYFNVNNKKIPLWYLEDKNQISNMISPPMVEGIENVNDNIIVLFESSSNYYKFYTKDIISSVLELKNIGE